MRSFVSLLFLLVFLNGPLLADALRLTSGQVIEGQILDESEAVVVIRTQRGAISVDRKDILDIERSGGPKKIARVPKERPRPLTAALLSFIPFYSGLYAGSEPALGLPFAAANGIYGLRLFRLLVGRTAYTNWADRNTVSNVFLLTSVGLGFGSQRGTPPTVLGERESTLFFGYALAPDVFRFVPTASVRVGGSVYTKDAFADYRRRTFYRYLGVSSLSGAAAYVLLRWFQPAAAANDPGLRNLSFASVVIESDPHIGTRVGVSLSF